MRRCIFALYYKLSLNTAFSKSCGHAKDGITHIKKWHQGRLKKIATAPPASYLWPTRADKRYNNAPNELECPALVALVLPFHYENHCGQNGVFVQKPKNGAVNKRLLPAKTC